MKVKMVPEVQELLTEPLTALGLGVRTTNALEEHGIMKVEQLFDCCPGTHAACSKRCSCIKDKGMPKGFHPFCYLLDIDNFGIKTLTEVMSKAKKAVADALERARKRGRRQSNRTG